MHLTCIPPTFFSEFCTCILCLYISYNVLLFSAAQYLQHSTCSTLLQQSTCSTIPAAQQLPFSYCSLLSACYTLIPLFWYSYLYFITIIPKELYIINVILQNSRILSKTRAITFRDATSPIYHSPKFLGLSVYFPKESPKSIENKRNGLIGVVSHKRQNIVCHID